MTTKTKTKAKKRGKRSGVVPDLSAGAEELSIYAGNSAQRDAYEAKLAYARADAWARDRNAKAYGGVKR